MADDRARYGLFFATAFDVEPLNWMLRKDGETDFA